MSLALPELKKFLLIAPTKNIFALPISVSSSHLCFLPSITEPSYISSFAGFVALGPVLFLCALSITIMIASYFAERSNRKSFIQKKQVQVSKDAFH